MNQFIRAVVSLDYDNIKQQLKEQPSVINLSEKNGKTALHYLAGVPMVDDSSKQSTSLKIAKLLLEKGADINAVHKIEENDGYFPATPVWYAYTKGRNKTLYRYLLKSGGSPDNCMFAIAWNDDVAAAKIFKQYGAEISGAYFVGAYYWKKYTIAKWFLENGADVNYIGPEGYSALLLAVKRKDPLEKIEWLLKNNADINKENKDGLSPKKLAEKNKQKTVLNLFDAYCR
jgi:ankyrin repeat protein